MPETKVLTTDSPQAILAAKQIIQQGGLIAFPTDTVYGVAADPFNVNAIEKIFHAKARPKEKALPVLIGNLNQITGLAQFANEWTRKIAETFWPGALTLVLPKNPHLPNNLSPYPTIGLRMPDLDFALQLLCEIGPLATTSANISGEPNPTTAGDVFAQLGGRINLLLDGGPTPGDRPSTVVDATGSEIKILRQGPITLSDLNKIFKKE